VDKICSPFDYKKGFSLKKIAFVVSVPVVATVFLSHQILTLSKIYDVTIITNLKQKKELLDWTPESVNIIDVDIHRNISFFYDLKALFILIRVFYKNRFILIHSVTPKAGLLAMIASWLVRTPVRLHTFTGQVWATKKGIGRVALRWLDWLTNNFATTILVDSFSQRDFLLKNRVVEASNSMVLGEGSISGVNSNRFKADSSARKKIRSDLKISDSVIVILFVGRFKRDKGILELVKSFSLIHEKNQNTALWLVGTDEENLQPALEKVKGVQVIPFSRVPEQYMAAADIFCLPSYREGFGSVVIEAAACGIPSIGSNIYGLSDAIVNEETGILIPVKSIKALKIAIERLTENAELRKNMGIAAHNRALDNFSQEKITEELIILYRDLLNK
jgi:glycosyltransferase involved in cell wall biosynthesis